ncbi:unnamed protein product, partial [Rotaria sp. Silwood1]
MVTKKGEHYWCPSSVIDVRLRPDSPVVLS